VRFILYKGQSQYGSLRLHIDQLAEALRAQAHEAVVLDLLAENAQDQVNAALADPPDCFFGMGGVGCDLKVGEESAYDVVGAVYASMYVDHPAHHPARLTTPIKKHAVFFLDRTHVQFMAAWPAGRAVSHLGFLPPGANELAEPADLSDEAFAKRDIRVLFTGTYRGEPQAPWREWEASPARTIVEEVAGRMAADGRVPVLEALKSTMADLGAELTPALMDQFVPLLQAPQFFAEAYHRDALIKAMGMNGVPLTLYGNGWEPLAARYPSFTWGGVGSFEETLHLVRRAKVVLNTNNGFVAGGHERVFTAMAAGAAVFSDYSKYYADVFKVGQEIALFAWPHMNEAPGQLSDLMSEGDKLARLARAGAKRVHAEHRWSDRAGRIVKAVKQIR
jgi:hypothetical protein